jgi:hypothetical protein
MKIRSMWSPHRENESLRWKKTGFSVFAYATDVSGFTPFREVISVFEVGDVTPLSQPLTSCSPSLFSSGFMCAEKSMKISASQSRRLLRDPQRGQGISNSKLNQSTSSTTEANCCDSWRLNSAILPANFFPSPGRIIAEFLPIRKNFLD